MLPPTYHTQRFTLQAYHKKDVDRFVEINMDTSVNEFMGGTFEIKEEAIALFHKIFSIYDKQNSDRWFWIWGIYEDNILKGHFELKETEQTDNTELEIVYACHPDERGKGLMSEILAFCKEKQKDWNKSIIATVNPENEISLSILNKWGIVKREIITDEEGDYLKLWLEH